MANITYFGIDETSKNLGIGREEFHVNFQNVSEPLSIVHSLCAFATDTLNNVFLLINHHGTDISELMELQLIDQYDLDREHPIHITVATKQFSMHIVSNQNSIRLT